MQSIFKPSIMEYLSKSIEDTPLVSDFTCSQPRLKQPLVGPESHEVHSDWTLIFHYKTQPCLQTCCEQWSSCWGYHSPVDRRRVPSFADGKFNYEGRKCGFESISQDSSYAYNSYEVAFHPLNYRTAICPGLKVADICYLYGQYCRYAHSHEELRTPSEIYFTSEPTSTWSDLLQLSELRGNLEAKLKQVTGLVERRKAVLGCAGCRGQRRFLYSGCGHAVCGKCSQGGGSCCKACGEEGELILLSC